MQNKKFSKSYFTRQQSKKSYTKEVLKMGEGEAPCNVDKFNVDKFGTGGERSLKALYIV